MQATLRPRSAGILLVAGSVLFGLGSVIVARVSLGAYAVAFWRLAVAAAVFLPLVRLSGQRWPQSRRALAGALLAGVFLAFDLALWHESIRAVGPGISTVLNCLQIFWLTAIGLMLFGETLGRLQLAGLLAALLIDSVFLHKPVSALQWAGAALTMLAIYLGSLKSGAKQEAA